MKTTTALLLGLLLLPTVLLAQRTKAQKDFLRFVKAYQAKAAKEYIAESGGMVDDTTKPASLIAKEEVELKGRVAPERTASFTLGWQPYAYRFTIVEWLAASGKKVYGVIRALSNYGEPGNPMFYKYLEVFDAQLHDIKKQVLPQAAFRQWKTAYQNAIKNRCDNYKGQRMVPLESEGLRTFTLGMAQGGTKGKTKTSLEVGVYFSTNNTVCRIPIGSLVFDKSKGIIGFRAY